MSLTLRPLWALLLVLPACAQSPWEIQGGFMVADRPVYDGASDRRTECAPLFAVQYRGAYLGPSRLGSAGALGYSTSARKPWVFLAEIGISPARLERRAHHLLGMGNRIENYWINAGIQRNFGATFLKLSTSGGLRADSGIQGTLTLGRRFLFEGWMLESQASVTGATRQNMDYDFGVSPEAAARRAFLVASGNRRLDASDLGSYAPQGGLRNVSVSATFIRPFNVRWSWIASARGTHLFEKASRSPLVRGRTAVSGAMGATYRF